MKTKSIKICIPSHNRQTARIFDILAKEGIKCEIWNNHLEDVKPYTDQWKDLHELRYVEGGLLEARKEILRVHKNDVILMMDDDVISLKRRQTPGKRSFGDFLTELWQMLPENWGIMGFQNVSWMFPSQAKQTLIETTKFLPIQMVLINGPMLWKNRLTYDSADSRSMMEDLDLTCQCLDKDIPVIKNQMFGYQLARVNSTVWTDRTREQHEVLPWLVNKWKGHPKAEALVKYRWFCKQDDHPFKINIKKYDEMASMREAVSF